MGAPISSNFYVNIKNNNYGLTSQIAISKHKFFENEELSINVFNDKIEFGLITIDSNCKSYRTRISGNVNKNSNNEQHRSVFGRSYR